MACLIGCATYLLLKPETVNPQAPIVGGFFAGVLGTWALFRLYALVRYGRDAKVSMD